MNSVSTAARNGLQQPQRFSDRHNLHAATFSATRAQASEQKTNSDQSGPIGEGSYEGSRDYERSIKAYLKKSNVRSDARAAQPDTSVEATDMIEAEKEGLSHTKAPGQ